MSIFFMLGASLFFLGFFGRRAAARRRNDALRVQGQERDKAQISAAALVVKAGHDDAVKQDISLPDEAIWS